MVSNICCTACKAEAAVDAEKKMENPDSLCLICCVPVIKRQPADKKDADNCRNKAGIEIELETAVLGKKDLSHYDVSYTEVAFCKEVSTENFQYTSECHTRESFDVFEKLNGERNDLCKIKNKHE